MHRDAGSAAERIAAIAAQAAFGNRLVTNTFRGLIAETIVSDALQGAWRWCAADYSAWDFDHPDGNRLEVKQAASRQTWHLPDGPASRIKFDIAARSGRHGDAGWIDERRRWANVYVFAHHPVLDDTVDHRDPAQWDFYVVAEARLPMSKEIALSKVKALTQSVGFSGLEMAVELVASS